MKKISEIRISLRVRMTQDYLSAEQIFAYIIHTFL